MGRGGCTGTGPSRLLFPEMITPCILAPCDGMVALEYA